MTEGRKREVRRLLGAVGLPVTRLVRVRVGAVRLGRLAPGTHRDLTVEEVRALSKAAGL
jgi:23S rRNA pseudouridine2605 synthase